jgi:hypothetical protein
VVAFLFHIDRLGRAVPEQHRSQTTMPLGWITKRFHMGSGG